MLRLMYFNADWCQPCKQMKPIIGELTEERPEVDFVSVDIEEDFETASKYQVRGVPTFVAIKDDEIIGRQVGATTKSKLQALLEA